MECWQRGSRYMSYILSLDAGTTSVRSVVINHAGEIVAIGQREISQHYPDHGHVEQAPLEIWKLMIESIKESLEKASIDEKEIATIGITNQRETTIVWDRKTGEALWHAIVWQDTRTKDHLAELQDDATDKMIYEKTGLRISSYFSASKIEWILDNVSGARTKAENGELCFGTVDTYLIWKLTNGKSFKTDVSNASRTLLFNIKTMKWDEELLKLFRIPEKILPEVVPSSHDFGQTECEAFAGPISISAVLGDQQSSLFGHTCFYPGEAKATYGTGCFLMANTGNSPSFKERKLLTTIGWQIGNKVTYTIEGTVFAAGSVIKWLRDALGIIREPKEIETLAASVPDSGGVYFVPCLNGLATPHWNMHALGTIQGLSLSSNLGHMARAALEGIAYQVADVIEVMEKALGKPLDVLKVGGGMSEDNFLLQIQADLLRTKIARASVLERTSLGTGYLAGLTIGFWNNLEEIRELWTSSQVFEPKLAAADIKIMRNNWQLALKSTELWTQHQ